MCTICHCIKYSNPTPQTLHQKEVELCVQQINTKETPSPAKYFAPDTITVEGLPKI